MRAQLVVAALLLGGCTTEIAIRGPYASTLAASDIKQIHEAARITRHVGRTVVTIEALQRDRVRIQIRDYDGSGWSGTTVYVVRRAGAWIVDRDAPASGESERTILVN
jgi:hypothetical protein